MFGAAVGEYIWDSVDKLLIDYSRLSEELLKEKNKNKEEKRKLEEKINALEESIKSSSLNSVDDIAERLQFIAARSNSNFRVVIKIEKDVDSRVQSYEESKLVDNNENI